MAQARMKPTSPDYHPQGPNHRILGSRWSPGKGSEKGSTVDRAEVYPVSGPGRKTKAALPCRGSAAPQRATPTRRPVTGRQWTPFRLPVPPRPARPGHRAGSRLGAPETEVWWGGHRGSALGAGAGARSLRKGSVCKGLCAVACSRWWLVSAVADRRLSKLNRGGRGLRRQTSL